MVNRSLISVEEAETLDANADASRLRRQRNAEAGLCINDTKVPSHAPRVPGKTKCQRCLDVQKYGASRIRLAPAAAAVVGGS